MRFFEFQNTDSVEKNLKTLLDLSTQDPSLEKDIIDGLKKILAGLDKDSEIKENTEDLEELQAQLLDRLNDPTLTDPADRLRVTGELLNLTQRIKKRSKNEALAELSKDIDERMKLLTQLSKNFSAQIKGVLITMVVSQQVEQKTVFEFLDTCAEPERLIDMDKIVNNPGPSTHPFVIPEKYKPIVRELVRLVPPGSSAATGKGELMLTLIGKNTVKPPIGDIEVGNKKIEVKASDISKSGVTDFVLSSHKQDVKSARTIFVNAVNSVHDKPIFLDAEAKISKGGISGISSINKSYLSDIQPMLQKMGLSLVQKTFKEMFEKVGLEQKSISEILTSFNTDGTIDYKKYSQALRKSSFTQYQKDNKHDGLLTINVKNLTYTYTENAEDFINLGNIQLERLFDFRPTPSAFTSFKQIN